MNRLIVCPYDDNHIVVNTRYKTHLEKCQERYIKQFDQIGIPVSYVKCAHNPSHVYLFPEIVEHEKQCPDRDPISAFVPLFKNGKNQKYLDVVRKMMDEMDKLVPPVTNKLTITENKLSFQQPEKSDSNGIEKVDKLAPVITSTNAVEKEKPCRVEMETQTCNKWKLKMLARFEAQSTLD